MARLLVVFISIATLLATSPADVAAAHGVHVSAWRGSNKGGYHGHGGGGGGFAPWGYYAKVPADGGRAKKHYYHHYHF